MKLSEILKGNKVKFTKVGNKKYYSIVSVLEQLEVSTRTRKYWYDARKKIEKKDKKILEGIKDLKVEASDGKMRMLDCASKSDLEKILKALPSKKVKVLFESKKEDENKTKKEGKKPKKNILKKKSTGKKEKTKKEDKKSMKKETKKITKHIKTKKVKGNDKSIKKQQTKKLKKSTNKKNTKKKKCGFICKIIKIFTKK